MICDLHRIFSPILAQRPDQSVRIQKGNNDLHRMSNNPTNYPVILTPEDIEQLKVDLNCTSCTSLTLTFEL